MTSTFLSTYQFSLRILTFWTQHKFLDETIQHVLQLCALMSTIHDVSANLVVHLSLGSQLTTKILAGIWQQGHTHKCEHFLQNYGGRLTRWWPSKSFPNLHHVDYHCLYAISFTFNLKTTQELVKTFHTTLTHTHTHTFAIRRGIL